MPMPKGYKSKHGYATVGNYDNGCDYRDIASNMTRSGVKMNHSTARNVFMSAMQKFAQPVHEHFEISIEPKQLQVTIKDPRFQSVVAELLLETKR